MLFFHEFTVIPKGEIYFCSVKYLQCSRKSRNYKTTLLIVNHCCDLFLVPSPSLRFDHLKIKFRVHYKAHYLWFIAFLGLCSYYQYDFRLIMEFRHVLLGYHIFNPQKLNWYKFTVDTSLLHLMNLDFSWNKSEYYNILRFIVRNSHWIRWLFINFFHFTWFFCFIFQWVHRRMM
jgi:hypothetical protein